MCLFQANRTAYLVHKLINISDDPTLKEEVMVRTAGILYNTAFVILLTVGQMVRAVNVSAIGTSRVCSEVACLSDRNACLLLN
jgi:hypothetical protein